MYLTLGWFASSARENNCTLFVATQSFVQHNQVSQTLVQPLTHKTAFPQRLAQKTTFCNTMNLLMAPSGWRSSMTRQVARALTWKTV